MAAGEAAPQRVYVPEFLRRAGLKPKEWMYSSKLTARVLLRPNWPFRVRVIGAMLVQAFGYEAELAVILAKGRFDGDKPIVRPLTPAGIALILNRATVEAYKESGLPLTEEERNAVHVNKRRLQEALAQNERDGIIARARINCPFEKLVGSCYKEAVEKNLVTPLRKLRKDELLKLGGKRDAVAVFLLAKPGPAKELSNFYDAENRVLKNGKSNPSNKCSEQIQLLFRFVPELRKYSDLVQSLVEREEIRQGIEAYNKAQEELKEKVRKAIAEAKPEAKTADATPQRKQVATAASAIPTSPKPAPEKVPAVPAAVPAVPIDARRPISQPAPVTPAQENVSSPEVFTVLQVMRRYCPADDDTAADLIRACRAQQPTVSAVQICEALRDKGPSIARRRDVDSPAKYLSAAVAKLFKGHEGALRTAPPQPVEPQPAPPVIELPAEDPASTWARVKADLKQQVSPESYRNWLADTREVERANGTLSVRVPDACTRDWLVSEYAVMVSEALKRAGVKNVEYRLPGAN